MKMTYGSLRDFRVSAARALNFGRAEGLAIVYFRGLELDESLFDAIIARSKPHQVISSAEIKALAAEMNIQIRGE